MRPPAAAARRIVNAIERDRARITVGPDARALDLFTRVVPRSIPAHRTRDVADVARRSAHVRERTVAARRASVVPTRPRE
jgi:hypothetical protein